MRNVARGWQGDEVPANSHLSRRLLKWYDRSKRDLPWRRRASDPYAQWVAEIMLQQTRVETVLRYYEPFIRRFPNVRTLARARHQTVLKFWEGLGYYRRVINLHKAARILDTKKADVPRTYLKLRGLPGLGEYTAAAVASIAFSEPVAAVDGNVARVMSRLFMIGGNIREARTIKEIRSVANGMVSHSRPGDFNQAVMDLGSSICTPRAPKCDQCPLESICESNVANRVGEFPMISPRVAAKSVRILAAAFVERDRVLLRRSGVNDLWPGCWELPMVELANREKSGDAMRRLAATSGIEMVGASRRGPTIVHQLTHRTLNFCTHVIQVKQDDSAESSTSRRWVTHAQFGRLPISSAHRKLLEALKPMLPDTVSPSRGHD